MGDVQNWLVVPDTHVPEHDPLATSIITQIMRDHEWAGVVHLGDYLDCGSISHFVRHFPLDQVEMPTLADELAGGKRLWDEWLSALGTETRVVWMEGNHEHRIKMLERSTPALRGLFDIPTIFKDYPIEFFETWKGKDVHGIPFRLGNCLLFHGRRHSKYHARWMSDDYAPWTILYGHVHDQNTFTKQSFRGPGEEAHISAAYSCGHLANPIQHYLGHYAMNWQQGFAEVALDDEGVGRVTVTPISKGRCVYRGKCYDGVNRRALLSVPAASRTLPSAALSSPGVQRPDDEVQQARALLAKLGW
jgi:predicted phosphodiesterase